MKICANYMKTSAMAALLAVSSAACKRSVNFTPLAKESLQPKTAQVLDSLVKEGQKILEDSEYISLGYDTLELTKDFSERPDKFIKKANHNLKHKYNDKVVFLLENNSIFDNSNRIGSAPKKYIYIDKTTVIPDSKTYTTDGKTVFVPVEYYGKVNPEISNFL